MRSSEELSDINMTPLVDIMLVLLIVFIIAAPLIVPQALDISLPKTEAVSSNQFEKPQLLFIYADGSFGNEVGQLSLDALNTWLSDELTPASRLVIHADETVQYGRVAQVMALAQNSGIAQITFRTVVQ